MRGLFCDKPVGYSECQTKRRHTKSMRLAE